MAKKNEKPKEKKPSKFDEKLIINDSFEGMLEVVRKNRERNLEKMREQKKKQDNRKT